MITRQLIKNYQQKYSNKIINWNFTMLKEWEYKMLTELGAIDEEKILCDGFSMKINHGDGETSYNDFGGNLQLMQEKVNEMNIMGGKKKAKIIKWAKTYTEYKKFKNDELERRDKQDYAIKMNRPPFAI